MSASTHNNQKCDGSSFFIDVTSTLTKITTDYTISSAKKRWRFACTAIYSLRVFVSLAKEVITKRNPHHYSKLFHTQSSSSSYIVDIIEPLVPQHAANGTSHYSSVPDVDRSKLANMVKDKNMEALSEFKGVEGVAFVVGTVPSKGIYDSLDDIAKRIELFGSNTYPSPPIKGFLHFVVEAFNDTTIIILLVCAGLSLGFGIKQHGAGDGWYEGGSIFLAVFLVVAVSSLSNFRQEKQFDKLSKISSNIKVDVVRNGRPQQVSIFEVLVGDVVSLKIGDQIPADGLFISGHSLYVDESSMTGESDHVEIEPLNSPFLLSGAKVVDGYAQMLVTSVGINTAWGQMMSTISRDTNDKTPLQARRDKLTSSIGKVGLAVAFLVFTVLLARYFTGNTQDQNGYREFNRGSTSTNDVLNSVVRIVAAAVTIVVVATPEGLPLAVTLTLAYSMKRMMKDQAMVRKLSACETMGSATVICTDKTGTLTLNEMRVTKFWLGLDNVMENYSNAMAPNVLELFHQGVGLNTTGSVYKASPGSDPEISGSPTEKAILLWAVSDLGMNLDELKQTYKILSVETFTRRRNEVGLQ